MLEVLLVIFGVICNSAVPGYMTKKTAPESMFCSADAVVVSTVRKMIIAGCEVSACLPALACSLPWHSPPESLMKLDTKICMYRYSTSGHVKILQGRNGVRLGMEGNPSGQYVKFWRKIIQQMRNVKDNTVTIVYTNQETEY